jgi:anti-sigma factor RsiW
MNDCRNIAADLSAFVDSELPAARRAEVEAHLAGCASCRARVAELRQLTAGLAAMPKAQPDRQFLAGVRDRLDERPRRDAWAGWPVRAAALAVFVVGFVAICFYGPRPRGREEKLPALLGAKSPAEVAQKKLETVRRYSDEAKLKDAVVPTAQPAAPPVGASVALADKSIAAAETIVVESDDLKQVRSDAQQVALALNGRLNLAQSISNSIYVEVPASNAEIFRSRFLNQEWAANRPQLNFDQTSTLGAGTVGGALSSNEPVSVLEIQVVPPKK